MGGVRLSDVWIRGSAEGRAALRERRGGGASAGRERAPSRGGGGGGGVGWPWPGGAPLRYGRGGRRASLPPRCLTPRGAGSGTRRGGEDGPGSGPATAGRAREGPAASLTSSSPRPQEPEWGPDAWQPLPPQPPGPVAVPSEGAKRPPAVHEISLWTVVAAVQAVERKVEAQAVRLLSLEGRAETAEKKMSELEKAVLEVGGQLERRWAALSALLRDSARRLEHVERQLRNRAGWVPRNGLGTGGDEPQVTGGRRQGEGWVLGRGG